MNKPPTEVMVKDDVYPYTHSQACENKQLYRDVPADIGLGSAPESGPEPRPRDQHWPFVNGTGLIGWPHSAQKGSQTGPVS